MINILGTIESTEESIEFDLYSGRGELTWLMLSFVVKELVFELAVGAGLFNDEGDEEIGEVGNEFKLAVELLLLLKVFVLVINVALLLMLLLLAWIVLCLQYLADKYKKIEEIVTNGRKYSLLWPVDE